MENDPAETTHVFEKNPEVVQELKILLEKYKEQGFSRAK
jgi:arylsulfatase A